MLSELFWLAFGVLVGWIAAILQDEYTPKRVLLYIVAGMAGGFAGGYGGGLLGTEALEYNASATGMMFAVFGAIAFVYIARLAGDNRSE